VRFGKVPAGFKVRKTCASCAGGMIRRELAWSAVVKQLQQAQIDRIADRHAVEKE